LYVATFSQKPQTLTQYSGVHNVTHAMCQADKELAKLQPRLEVNLMGVTNTYSIEGAIRDFDYKPTNNHDLTEVVEYYKKFYEENPSTMCFDIRQTLKILLFVVLFTLFIVRYLFS
uniref:SDR family NAD(P)-dependent oxidoreductase n=1 Tax=Heligmosomoides polygyrus TaxID=6339 RepID=A0A183F821_HELPZ